jgi:hypothetical protein
MINYENILKTASEILSNNNIYKENLIIYYKLTEHEHRKLDEHLFFKGNPKAHPNDFKPSEIIEIEISTIKFRFVKQDGKI